MLRSLPQRTPLAFVPVLALAVLAAALPAKRATASAPQEGAAAADPAAREWSQARGNAAGTLACAVEPIRTPPVEAWRLAIELESPPVAWGGVVYAVGVDVRRRMLFAIDAASGEVLARSGLGRGERARLAVWQGTVCVLEPESLRTLRFDRGRFRTLRTERATWSGGPVAYHGWILATTAEGALCVLDIRRGRLAAELAGAGAGSPAVMPAADGTALVAVPVVVKNPSPYRGTYVQLSSVGLRGVDSREVELALEGVEHGAPLVGSAPADASGFTAARLDAGPVRSAWHVHGEAALRGTGGEAWGVLVGAFGGGLSPFVAPPAIHDGRAFGFDADGALIELFADGRFRKLSEEASRRADCPRGPVSIAGDVLYVGSWGLEIAGGRILWSVPGLEAATPLVPAGDGRAVVGTAAGDLVGLAEPDAGGAGGAGAVAAGPADHEPLPLDAGDGVVLADGRFLLGRVERGADGALRLAQAEEGEPLELALADVALVVGDGRVERTGEEHPVCVAWEAALAERVHALFVELFEDHLKGGFVTEARALLAEARELGLPADLAAELDGRLTGRAQNRAANAAAQLRRLDGEMREHRRELVDGYVAAADWCKEHDLPVAATVLLVRAERLLAGEPDVAERAAALVPRELPGRDAEDAVARWMRWAVELLPAGAEFLPEDHPARRRADHAPWTDGAIALRTRNVVLLSMSTDPAVVGACLRNGEGTVRALQELLDARAPLSRPLQVLLHRNRAEYLAEEPPGGARAMGWSAGYYSPAEQLSRFHVPEETAGGESLDRGLYKVLSHELTHHFLEQEWMPGSAAGRVGRPGYWIVEGFARFVEDQAVEMGRLGAGFADPTVKSLDAAAKVAELGKLLDVARFVDLSQARFHTQLGDEGKLEVRLSNTLRTTLLSERAVFYEQAGSLVFFLMHRRGPEGRAKLVDYMRGYYGARSEPRGWEALGFESAAQLDAAYRAFLAEL